MVAGQHDKMDRTHEVMAVPGVTERVDFFDMHSYFQYLPEAPEGDLTNKEIPGLIPMIAEAKNVMHNLVTTFSNRAPGDIKYYMGEYNMTNPVSHHHTELVESLPQIPSKSLYYC